MKKLIKLMAWRVSQFSFLGQIINSTYWFAVGLSVFICIWPPEQLADSVNFLPLHG